MPGDSCSKQGTDGDKGTTGNTVVVAEVAAGFYCMGRRGSYSRVEQGGRMQGQDFEGLSWDDALV